MPASARAGSVKEFLNGAPISSSRVHPVSASVCLLTSVMMPRGSHGHQRVDVGFDQRARVEVLVAQPLVELLPLFFDLLARGVVGADQQVADDGVLRVAQRRDRHHRREPAAVLADVGQLVDVLDAARGLEHQRLEARRDRGAELDAERRGARDDFLRIGDVGRRDLVHHLGGGVAQHPLGADVEDLDDALGVGGDAREVGAVEDRALQRARLDAAPLPPACARCCRCRSAGSR